VQVFVVGSFVVACSVIVARLPRAGESLDAAAFVSEPGGKGFNLALALHRLGFGITGVFAIGDDAFAAIAESAFAGSGLGGEMLVRHPGSTGAGVGFVDARGENCLAVSLGANRLLDAGDVERAGPSLDAASLVVATFESPDAPIRAAFVRARARGAATLLNPSPSRPIDSAILAATTVLVVNRIEADDLGLDGSGIAEGGTGEAARFEALSAQGPELIVVTLGEQGALAYRRGRWFRQAAFPVAVVDTIGAGDAFAAGLSEGLLRERPIEECLCRAAACGALTACRLGAFDAFPTAEALDAFLAAPHAAGHL